MLKWNISRWCTETGNIHLSPVTMWLDFVTSHFPHFLKCSNHLHHGNIRLQWIQEGSCRSFILHMTVTVNTWLCLHDPAEDWCASTLLHTCCARCVVTKWKICTVAASDYLCDSHSAAAQLLQETPPLPSSLSCSSSSTPPSCPLHFTPHMFTSLNCCWPKPSCSLTRTCGPFYTADTHLSPWLFASWCQLTCCSLHNKLNSWRLLLHCVCVCFSAALRLNPHPSHLGLLPLITAFNQWTPLYLLAMDKIASANELWVPRGDTFFPSLCQSRAPHWHFSSPNLLCASSPLIDVPSLKTVCDLTPRHLKLFFIKSWRMQRLYL